MKTLLIISLISLVIGFIVSCINMISAVRGKMSENTFVVHMVCAIFVGGGTVGAIVSGIILIVRHFSP